MSAPTREFTLSRDDYDAVLFDLDGVITATANVHSTAWKKLFDAYLGKVSMRDGSPFREFDDEDYRVHVDGKPRYEGIRCFLESRDIHLPFGEPGDAEDVETVCGLGNQKNRFFNEALKTDGVEVFHTSVELIHALRDKGIRIAVVTSSKNCATVLAAAGISDLFEVRFDGNDAARDNIAGKPRPDTYLEAARRLGVRAERAVVVEDAISGVQAGRAGEFALVVGVDRTGDAEGLRANGADVVVKDLGELSI
jgi:beta-phosphoglucomutase family hydrolase